MTGQFGLDWAILALSITNTILLMWLGTTVLLNTERRTWGGWLAASGLLLGGVFFVSHTAILGYGFTVEGVGVNLWWVVGLLAVSLLPFLWYVMMLWYSGYWQSPEHGSQNQLASRHRPLLFVSWMLVIGLLLVALKTPTNPIPASYPIRGLEQSFSSEGLPLVLVLYPGYVVACLVFSLDALRKPGPSHRRMGDLARKRARPWLVGASLALLLVGLAVSVVFAWLFQYLGNFQALENELIAIGWFDVSIQALITLAVILLGQAVVAYEIFTGQTLPRQGFIRQWQRAVLLGLGYGLVIGFTLSTNLRPIYAVLLSVLLMTSFFAMLSWRTVSERQRAIASLRPFVVSQRFYDQLLAPSTMQDPDPGMETPFKALCQEVLNTRLAFLIAIGPLAPLAGKPMVYPENLSLSEADIPDPERVSGLVSMFSPEVSILRVREDELQSVEWAVPLWSERGLVGVLFLGGKQDGGIYSQEEIGIAQAIGERLIDTKASAEIARRLMGLQRQRLAETQVLDQRARRVLHDEVLQQLHTAMLTMDKAAEIPKAETEQALDMLADVHAQISALLRSMPGTSLPLLSQAGLIESLKKLLESEMASAFDNVEWEIPAELHAKAGGLSHLETEVVYYAAREAIRNAAHHGRSQSGSQPLNLVIELRPAGRLCLVIEDDGLGIKAQQKALLRSGGQGLALHSTMMAVIGGELTLESEAGVYTRVILRLP